MKEVNHKSSLSKIFSSARETNEVEFKETFNWGSNDRYARSMAAFTNNKGGYLIFGVTNQPRKIVGLSGTNFENLDEATIASYLNNLFSPEIQYEKFVFKIHGKKLGIIYTHPAEEKPVIAIKNDGEVKEAEIYYRYNARNDKIKYPELKKLFINVLDQERKSWMNLFERVSKIGPSNSVIMDMVNGTIEGENNSLLIDKKLIAKLKFIKEGHFSEKGKTALKLIGDVRPVTVSKYKSDTSKFRLTDDPSAFAVREEVILKNYPLVYADLIKKVSNRYSNFKNNKDFHKLKRKLMENSKYSHVRYLNPKNKNGSRQHFYSESIIREFDKHYKKKKK
ncbi:MAG: ATP-binding protein [Candidatus Paceibacterota bacterium]